MDANQPAKRTHTVKPNKDCPYCHGSGTVNMGCEYYDSAHGPRYELCDCVIDQTPPGTVKIELDLSDFDPTYKLDVREG